MNNSKSNTSNGSFLMGITLVATLGGLLFGYDTAVISGTVGALKEFFVQPLYDSAELATSVILQFKWIAVVCFTITAGLISSFFFKLFDQTKAIIYSVLLFLLFAVVVYYKFIDVPNIIDESMANTINGFTISSALLGCIIGGSMGGVISQRMGRKGGLILSAILFTISAIGSAVPDYINFLGENAVISSFIIYRVIGGIGVGVASMLAPMYIAEIAPPAQRGKLVSFNQFAIVSGMLIVYFVNYLIAQGQPEEWLNSIGWRWMFASEIIPAILFFVFLLGVPESPRFLVFQDKGDEALAVLKKLSPEKEALATFEDIKKTLVEKHAPWLSFGGAVIVIGVFLSVFQQFVGINVVLYYAPEIFRNLGSSTDSSLMQTIIVGAINLLFTVIAITTVDKFGRKPLQIIGAVGMAFSMLLLGTVFYLDGSGVLALIAMLLYVASFAMSWGPVTWVLLAEIFPNKIKGALSIAVAAQWLANLTVSWTFPIMNDNTWLTEQFHHGFAYWIYGIMSIFAALFMWKVVPETKGRSLESMEELWSKKNNGSTVKTQEEAVEA